MFVPLALLGAFQSIREELPSSVQHRVQLPDYVPTWPWWAWLLILYSLVLAIILESTFRLQRKQGTQQPSHPGAINIMGGQQNIYQITANESKVNATSETISPSLLAQAAGRRQLRGQTVFIADLAREFDIIGGWAQSSLPIASSRAVTSRELE